MLEELPGNGENVYIFEEVFNQRILLLEGDASSWTETEQWLRSRLTEMIGEVTINIAYTGQSVSWEELSHGWQKTYKQMFDYFVIGKSQSISSELPKKEAQPAILSAAVINHIQTLLNSGNTEGVRTAILTLFQEWDEMEAAQQYIEKMLYQIMILFQQSLFFSEEDYDRMYQNVFWYLESEMNLLNGAEKIAEELAVWAKQKQEVPSEIGAAIEQMEEYIRKHYTETINLAELAEKYHFNHSYMTRLFKKLKGHTPMKLINTLRMDDAKEMLKNNSISVREISETLGFADQHYFSRIFKETTGMTPKEYRAEYMNRS